MNFKTVHLIAAALLFLAMLDLPYGYYKLLRIIICIVACLTAYTAYNHDDKSWVWIFSIIAVLFNPVIPFYLEKEIWTVLDFLTASIFIVSVLKNKFTNGSSKKTIT